jgi:O-antigen/teichoic acid export membrane protein
VFGNSKKLSAQGTLVSKSSVVFASQLLIVIQSLVMVPIIIHTAGTEVYGAFVLFMTFSGFFVTVSSLGLSHYCRRVLPAALTKQDRHQLFWPQFWFQLFSISILYLALLACYELIYVESLAALSLDPLIVFAYTFFIVVFGQAAMYFRDTHQTVIFSMALVVGPYLSMLILLSLVYGGSLISLNTLILTSAIGYALISQFLMVKIAREIRLGMLLPDKRSFFKGVSFGLPLVAAGLLDVVLLSSDKLLIGSLLSVKDVGNYVPAYMIGAIILMVPKVILTVLYPYLSKACSEGTEVEAAEALKKLSQAYLMLAIPFVGGTAALSQDLLELYTNQEIAKAGYLVVPLIAGSAIFSGLLMLKMAVLFVRGKTRYVLKVNVVMALTIVCLNIFLITLFERIWVCGIAAIICFSLGYYLVSLELRTDPLVRRYDRSWIALISLLTVMMSVVLLLVRHYILIELTLAHFITLGLLGFILYGLPAGSIYWILYGRSDPNTLTEIAGRKLS